MDLGSPPRAARSARAISRPRGFSVSMKPAISSTYLPAKGLWITESAAARRRGIFAAGPPSWKISSTSKARLRSCTSGMDEPPGGKFEWQSHVRFRDDAGLALERQRAGGDEVAREKRLRDQNASGQGFAAIGFV